MLLSMLAAVTVQVAEPAAPDGWNTGTFEIHVDGQEEPAATGHLLYMTQTSDAPSALFQCNSGIIYPLLSVEGGDLRAAMEQRTQDRVTRRSIRWAVGENDWSRPERWEWRRVSNYFRPVSSEATLAMWDSAKSGEDFRLKASDEEITVHWPEHDAAVDDFIEACGWES